MDNNPFYDNMAFGGLMFPFSVVDPDTGYGLVDFGDDTPIMRVRMDHE